jgi:hypothetical protein
MPRPLVYPCAPRQVYRRVPVSFIGYVLVAAELPDGRYVCVGYFCGCVDVCALDGSVHSTAEIPMGHARASVHGAPEVART